MITPQNETNPTTAGLVKALASILAFQQRPKQPPKRFVQGLSMVTIGVATRPDGSPVWRWVKDDKGRRVERAPVNILAAQPFDGSKYPGAKLRAIRADGKHR